ncbi:Down syndrome cell adhesion molecule-like protein Dscam2 isoform X2 [Oopsacas minuta]|uniref:Down syndrome cell adhesion molecule-like protein Dscam2 isoform X2 n=1 Tax=Oopsacas minuta TaxID=111878 RepID=A0AAV7KH66_9METZ|nr:Down syndrome cell adhesion molecule-like protein Dscam2 isoform X2 [Oopsacas minuta]
MFSLHLFILLLLLLLFSREVTSLNERVEFKINNKTTTTFFPNTNQQIHIIPVATTNIQLVCYPDNELASWHVSLTSVTTDGNTVILNRFTSNEVGVYECRFGDGQYVTPISISLQATGHGVYYISNGEYGTISTEETGIPKQLILKPDQLYRVICSGEAPEWRDDVHNIYIGVCNGVRDVCQEVVSEVEAGLLFEESAAPFEYVCRVNIDLTHHSHNILFLPEDGVIPQNINISTEPYFPLIDGRITIRTLEVLITCSCEANPPVTPENYIILYKGYSNSDMISVEAGFEDHTVEYMVTCYVDNGISRDEAIQVTFNFSIEIPKISILSITTSMIEFTWGSVSQYLEEYVIYKTSYVNGVNMEVNTYTNGSNSYSDSIDGLMACSEYYIQVLAYIEEIKEIDGGEYGTILVTTESEDIRESPSNLITQSTGSRHVFITWTEVSTKSCTLYPINYTITYQSVSPDTSSSGSLVRHDIDTNKLDNGDLYAIITELEEYYEYDISVFASNWRGNGPVTRTMIRTKATGMLS